MRGVYKEEPSKVNNESTIDKLQTVRLINAVIWGMSSR
jgi:hypothetical protein